MSDEQEIETTDALKEETSKQPNIVTKITLGTLAFCCLYFVWYLVADRFTPATDQARVQALIIPITAGVSGRITRISASSGRLIKKGEPLIKLDDRHYQAAVDKARSDLESAGQDVGAGTASIASAQARVTDAMAHFHAVQAENSRILTLVQKGIYAKAKADQTKADLDQAAAKVGLAEADLDREKAALGKQGEDNHRIKAALSALESAEIDLNDTQILAPTDGGISNVNLEVGHYAQAGQPLLTFIANKNIWIEAYLRENNLGHLKPGNPVEIALDIAPGQIFDGTVSNIGFGVQWDQSAQVGELQKIKVQSSWLRDAQRFPVLITFSDDSAHGLQRLGGQADIIVYTGDNMILNLIGKIWIRVNSYMSYLY